MYLHRFYRSDADNDRFKSFVVKYKETDIWVAIDSKHYKDDMQNFIYNEAVRLRKAMEDYLVTDPGYKDSLVPYEAKSSAPKIAKIMSKAAKKAQVGPMAAVAGAFSQQLAKAVEKEYKTAEIIIENGGDIYMNITDNVTTAIFAGESSLSNKIGLEIPKQLSPLGICTSSGTVGPSLSFGKADAVTIICKDAALADAFATTFGNMVKCQQDIEEALEESRKFEEIIGILIIVNEKIGARGNIKIVPIE